MEADKLFYSGFYDYSNITVNCKEAFPVSIVFVNGETEPTIHVGNETYKQLNLFDTTPYITEL